MSLRDRILSDTNIYAAIYALPNTLREKSLICGDQQQYLKDLREVYRYGASHDKFISHCKDKFFENDIRNNHPKNSATIIRKGRLGFELDEFVRNAVAIISEAHGAKAKAIYTYNDEPEIINSQKLKIMLRIVDTLDMCEERVSPYYLSLTEQQIPDTSKFH